MHIDFQETFDLPKELESGRQTGSHGTIERLERFAADEIKTQTPRKRKTREYECFLNWKGGLELEGK